MKKRVDKRILNERYYKKIIATLVFVVIVGLYLVTPDKQTNNRITGLATYEDKMIYTLNAYNPCINIQGHRIEIVHNCQNDYKCVTRNDGSRVIDAIQPINRYCNCVPYDTAKGEARLRIINNEGRIHYEIYTYECVEENEEEEEEEEEEQEKVADKYECITYTADGSIFSIKNNDWSTAVECAKEKGCYDKEECGENCERCSPEECGRCHSWCWINEDSGKYHQREPMGQNSKYYLDPETGIRVKTTFCKYFCNADTGKCDNINCNQNCYPKCELTIDGQIQVSADTLQGRYEEKCQYTCRENEVDVSQYQRIKVGFCIESKEGDTIRKCECLDPNDECEQPTVIRRYVDKGSGLEPELRREYDVVEKRIIETPVETACEFGCNIYAACNLPTTGMPYIPTGQFKGCLGNHVGVIYTPVDKGNRRSVEGKLVYLEEDEFNYDINWCYWKPDFRFHGVG